MNSKFYMAGTEGTGAYLVVLCTDLGRVGYRVLSTAYRVRVEPADGDAASVLAGAFLPPTWKQPGDNGQNRFSTMVYSGQRLEAVVKTAVAALCTGFGPVEVNPDAPDWAKAMVEACQGDSCETEDEAHARLLAEAKELGIPGANRRWSAATLLAKVQAHGHAGAETEGEEQARLVAKARELKIPGANLASRWSLATLRSKVSAGCD